MNNIVDLRSDTVTKPSKEMRIYMAEAEVGDDVYGEDPTVNELQKFCADMFGMEDGLFMPSGTMANQVAIKVWTKPMDEVILEGESHVYFYEGGGVSYHSGASVKLLSGEGGMINAKQVKQAINKEDVHFPTSRIVVLENTTNRGGGRCYEWNKIEDIKKVCKEKNLKLHLDGARLFNALVKTNQKPADYGKTFDSISICLSKGLGAPVGSVLLGNKSFIAESKRVRKVFGGGMRQVGILAAAGLYAMKNNIRRLQQDHGHAEELANHLMNLSFVKEVMPQETNIVIFKVHDSWSAENLVQQWKSKGLFSNTIGSNCIRFVTHLNILPEHIGLVKEILHSTK